MAHKDPVVRRAAVTALQRLQPTPAAVAAALAQALDDPEPFVRVKAAEVLLQGSDPPAAALATLVEELRGRDSWMRSEAAQQLEKAGAKARPVAAALLALTGERDRMTRVYACRALSRLGGAEAERAGAALRELLTDESVAVRARAAEALWDQGAVKEALPVLVGALGTNDAVAAGTANQVLQRIGTTGPQAQVLVPVLADALADAGPAARTQILSLLQRMGQTARLGDPDTATRFRTLAALAAAGTVAKEAAPAVAALLRDPNRALRLEAAVAVAQIGASNGREEALKVLLESLNPGSPRATASPRVVEAVGRLGADAAPAVPALVRLLSGRVPTTRAAAAEALGAIGKPAKEAVPALEKLLKTGDGHGKAHAAVALWRITGVAGPVVPALTAALDDPALRRPTTPTYPAYPPQPPVRPGVTQTVYYAPYTRTAPGYPDLLVVIHTLGEIGPAAKPAAEAQRQLTKGPELEIAKAAAEALKRIESDAEPK